MKKIITMFFVCMSSLGYGAESDAFNTDVPLAALIGQGRLLDGAVLAVPGVVVPELAAVERSMDIQPGQTICGVCDKHFSSHAALIIHNRTHTGEKPYPCKTCGKEFTQKGSLERHMEVHREKPFVCSYEGCASQFAHSGALERHMKTHSGERPYACSHQDCASRFSLKSNLEMHMRTHTGKKPYACSHEGCGKAFTQSQHLKTHMKYHSGEKLYVCSHEGCGKAFTQKPNLKKHIKVHEQADKATSRSLSLEQAVDNDLEKDKQSDNADESEHRSKRMRCFDLPVPGSAPAPVSMNAFESLPSDQIDGIHSYFCGARGCYECFSTIQDRTEHEIGVHGQGYSQAPGFQVFQEDGNGEMMMAQDGLGSVSLQQPVVVPEAAPVQRSMDLQPRQKICGVCGKSFSSNSRLIVHMRTHTGERPYVCFYKDCGSRFARSHDLKNHVRSHAGEKPYACSYEGCASRFALSQYLKEHVRTHTGEKPFVCSYEGCGKAFTLPHHLKGHMTTHTGERPFGCKECGKWFIRSNHLKDHMRIHTGEKPYVCSHQGCTSRFARSGDLKGHMRRVHEQADKAPSGSLSFEQVPDNNLEEDEESDNDDESQHNAKRMRSFDRPAPGPAPAP